MKKVLFTSMLVGLFAIGYSQSDTLFTKKQQKIACKIVEISDQEIRYKQASLPDGPVYVINRINVYKYTLANGYTELIVPDEMSIEHEHNDILKNRTAIKTAPFSAVNNQISLAYEKVIKVGMNLDVEVGYVNNSINKETPLMTGGVGQNNPFYAGAYIKPGIKFFLGQDYSVKGMKYAHPLKGRYIKLDVAASFLNYSNVQRMVAVPTQPGPPYYYGSYTYTMIRTNISSVSYGAFVNYGRQFILGNILTLEYYVGVGFTGQNNKYSNQDYPKNNSYYYSDDARNISNYHAFLRIPGLGLSGTAGFRVGYILPDKKMKKPEAVKH